MGHPSKAQKNVRQIFRASCDCWRIQPIEGGAVPPAGGPRNRSWWFDEAAADDHEWLYRGRTPSWDGKLVPGQTWADWQNVQRPPSWFAQKDELGFLVWYDDMKGLYGYPWSATNDVDEIARKIWFIIASEIEYVGGDFGSLANTPGGTTANGWGVCDEMSVLYYSFMWKALGEVGKSDAWVKEHLAYVENIGINTLHVFCWWKDKNGDTRIIETTADSENIPPTIYNLALFTATPGENLILRVNHDGEWEPWVQPPPPLTNLRYYNYFMHRTLLKYHAGLTPSWCQWPTEGDTLVASFHPDDNFEQLTNISVRLSFDTASILRAYIITDAVAEPWAIRVYVEAAFNSTEQPWPTLSCHALSPPPWDYTTITWNNQPALAAKLDTQLITATGWYSIKVLGHKAVCLKFTDETIPGLGYVSVDMRSENHVVEETRPYWQF